MTHLRGEELKKFLDDVEKHEEEDHQWLLESGWKELDEVNYLSPIGKKFAFHDAVNQAEWDLFHKYGWTKFRVVMHYPEQDQDYQDRKKQEQEENQAIGTCFIHVSKRIYHWFEVVELVRFHDNNDSEYDNVCPKTEQIQAILHKQNIVPQAGMILNVNFILDKEVDKYKYHYKSVE